MLKDMKKSTFSTKLNKILLKISSLFYKKIVDKIAVIDLEPGIYSITPTNKSLRFKEIFLNDIELLESILKNKATIFENRLQKATGHLIFETFEEPAGFGWFSDKIQYTEGVCPFTYTINPKKGYLYFFDGYIFPDKRGRNLHLELLKHRVNEAHKLGYKKVFLTFNKRNIAIEKHISSMGFKIVGEIYYKRILFFATQNITALKLVCQDDY